MLEAFILFEFLIRGHAVPHVPRHGNCRTYTGTTYTGQGTPTMTSTITMKHSSASKSLWNFSLSPGWTKKEVEVFEAALTKYGIGNWTNIIKHRCLPGKTVAQLYNQTQRLLGQQSLAEFQGLSLNIRAIFARNLTIKGKRKNNCLVNSGNKLTRPKLEKLKIKNQEEFGIAQDVIDSTTIPELTASEMSHVLIQQGEDEDKVSTQTRLQKIQRIRRLQGYLSSFKKQHQILVSVSSIDSKVHDKRKRGASMGGTKSSSKKKHRTSKP